MEIKTAEEADAYFKIKSEERIIEIESKLNGMAKDNSLVVVLITGFIFLIFGYFYWSELQQPASLFWVLIITTMSLPPHAALSAKRTKLFLELIELKTKKV